MHLLDESRLVKGAAVGHDRHRLRHLQRRNLGIALPDGKIGDVAIQQLPAMCCFHIGVVRNAAFHLAANRYSAFGAEAESLCPIDDRLSAGLYTHLVEPGIARFGQGLNEIEEATIAFLPIVKRQVTDLD